MKSIRVMHVIHQLGAGGAENGIINIVKHIDHNRFKIAICAFVAKGIFTERLDKEGIALFDLEKKPGNDVRIPLKLLGLLKRWKPDILHTHGWGTLCEGLLAAKLGRIPVVIHGEHGTIQRKPLNIQVQRILWYLTDQVLSVSENHRKALGRVTKFPLHRIQVIPNGVDTEKFAFSMEGKKDYAFPGIKRGDMIIGTIGRLVPVKNQTMLIKAFSRLSYKCPQVQLFIVGEGPLRAELSELTNSLGVSNRVHFLGQRLDIPDLLKCMDVFALTSTSEGMSNTILEAMCTGLPVIATNVGGNMELVKKDLTGFLIKCNDVNELADRLETLVRNPNLRERMGSAARQRVETHFSLNKMIRKYEELYVKLYKKVERTTNERLMQNISAKKGQTTG